MNNYNQILTNPMTFGLIFYGMFVFVIVFLCWDSFKKKEVEKSEFSVKNPCFDNHDWACIYCKHEELAIKNKSCERGKSMNYDGCGEVESETD